MLKDELLFSIFKKNFAKLLQLCEEIKRLDSNSYEIQQILPILDSDGFVDCKSLKKINFSQFLLNNFSEIRNTEPYQDILKTFSGRDMFLNFYAGQISGEENGRIIEKPTAKDIAPLVEDFIKDLTTQYLEIKKSFVYDDKIFSELYSAMEKFVLYDHDTFYCFIPLYGLKSNFDNLQLDDVVEIKRLSPLNYSQVVDLDIADSPSFKPSKKFWKLKYAIYLKLENKTGNLALTKDVMEICKKVLESLRLFKTGSIHLGAMYPYSPDMWIRKSLPPRVGTENPPDYEMKLELLESELDEFAEFYKQYSVIPFVQAKDSMRYISTSIRRFNASYNDKYVEDKITNLTIALECLLTMGPGEIQNKLSLRGALLLGKDENEREYFWRLIRMCYDVRSDIVHGRKRKENRINDKTLTDTELLTELEKTVRKTIIAVIKLQKSGISQKNLIDVLDVSAVNRNKLVFEKSEITNME